MGTTDTQAKIRLQTQVRLAAGENLIALTQTPAIPFGTAWRELLTCCKKQDLDTLAIVGTVSRQKMASLGRVLRVWRQHY